MPRLAVIDPKDAPEDLPEDAARILATAPINLYRGLAANAPVLASFTAFMRSIGSAGGLTKAEKELVMLRAAESRRCGYCVAAHTKLAAGAGVDATRALAARRGQGGGPREQALLDFVDALGRSNGDVPDEALAAFRSAGFDDRAAIDVVAAVSAMAFTALYNHLNRTELDFPPVPEA